MIEKIPCKYQAQRQKILWSLGKQKDSRPLSEPRIDSTQYSQ